MPRSPLVLVAPLPLLVIAAACVHHPASARADGLARQPGEPAVTAEGMGGRRGALASKRVETKDPPHRLIAIDGTSCIVSEKKFASVNVGRSVWCTWMYTDR